MAKTGKPSLKKTESADKKRHGDRGEELSIYRGRYVVVDTNSHFIFIGKLSEVGEHFMTLTDVDVHDRRESPSTNEKYIMDAKKYGVRPNRKLVHVCRSEVISISALDDVVEY